MHKPKSMKRTPISFITVMSPLFLLAQNVGIGTTNPTGPLSFASTAGNKLVLWGDGNSSHYGIGVQVGLLQIYTNQATDGVAIGYGRSASFVEGFRVQGNGNIGVGTPSPVVRLDIAGTDGWNLVDGEGDMRIGNATTRLKFGVALGGGGIGTAGIMQHGGAGVLNIGAAGKYMVQLAGSANYINLQNITGGLRINNNAGAAGQVLTSGGPSAAPYWSAPSSSTFNQVLQTSRSADLPYGGQDVDLPGAVANFTLATAARVVFNYRASIVNNGCSGCGNGRTFLLLKQVTQGGAVSISNLMIETSNYQYSDGVSGPITVDLPAGSYSFKLSIRYSTSAVTTTYADLGKLSWQVYQ
jgi:hypothetical protein